MSDLSDQTVTRFSRLAACLRKVGKLSAYPQQLRGKRLCTHRIVPADVGPDFTKIGQGFARKL